MVHRQAVSAVSTHPRLSAKSARMPTRRAAPGWGHGAARILVPMVRGYGEPCSPSVCCRTLPATRRFVRHRTIGTEGCAYTSAVAIGRARIAREHWTSGVTGGGRCKSGLLHHAFCAGNRAKHAPSQRRHPNQVLRTCLAVGEHGSTYVTVQTTHAQGINLSGESGVIP